MRQRLKAASYVTGPVATACSEADQAMHQGPPKLGLGEPSRNQLEGQDFGAVLLFEARSGHS